MAQGFLAVHIRAVTASHIFQHHPAVYGQDLSLLAADAAIAKSEFVTSLTANAVRRGRNRNLAAYAVGFDHNESGSAWHRFILDSRRYSANPHPGASLLAPHMVGKVASEVNSGWIRCAHFPKNLHPYRRLPGLQRACRIAGCYTIELCGSKSDISNVCSLCRSSNRS